MTAFTGGVGHAFQPYQRPKISVRVADDPLSGGRTDDARVEKAALLAMQTAPYEVNLAQPRATLPPFSFGGAGGNQSGQ